MIDVVPFETSRSAFCCCGCRSGNHHAELVIYHFEGYNIYHIKTRIRFNFPIRVSTMESPKCSSVHTPKMRVEA